VRAQTLVEAAAFADPLLHLDAHRRSRIGLAVGGALVLYVAATLLGIFSREAHRPPRRPYERSLQVRVLEAPKPPVPIAPMNEPVPKPPVVPKTVKVEKISAPPPDPINVEAPPPPEPPKEPPRRVVGISMESTVSVGAPFAVGNTRMGETSQVAEDPRGLAPLGPEVTAPKRTSAPPPEYPATLRARGIEGDVGLEVEIEPSGGVGRVTVVSPSEHEEFNRSAKQAAQGSTYEPARVNGVAVSRVIEFTVRFRLHQ
jgi:protein TonB